MNSTIKVLLVVALLAVVGALLVGVMGVAALLPFRSSVHVNTQSETGSPIESDIGLANPASEFCVEQGYTLQMLEDDEGNQYGVCIFPDGDQCDEWAFYRGECGPVVDE
jgi:putative hemolysin